MKKREDPKELLAKLRAKEIPDRELHLAILQLDRASLTEARGDIESLTRHPDPLVRNQALTTLTFSWPRREYLSLAEEFFLHDTDPENRSLGAVAVGFLGRTYGDYSKVDLLLNAIIDENEDEFVRAGAYKGLLDLIGLRKAELPASRAWNPAKDINWDLIRALKDIIGLKKTQ